MLVKEGTGKTTLAVGDVANDVGVIQEVEIVVGISRVEGATKGTDIIIPTNVLAWGGFGIVARLMMWAYRVIATIGKKITVLTPRR
ncbi:Inorganic phosphate transporter 2-1 [Spatholobus suberectus]|nr:Inorganic phosphate transporter 2-1 [Spatholobus suberectus]